MPVFFDHFRNSAILNRNFQAILSWPGNRASFQLSLLGVEHVWSPKTAHCSVRRVMSYCNVENVWGGRHRCSRKEGTTRACVGWLAGRNRRFGQRSGADVGMEFVV